MVTIGRSDKRINWEKKMWERDCEANYPSQKKNDGVSQENKSTITKGTCKNRIV